MVSLDEVIRTSKVKVCKGRYAYLKVKGANLQNYFMVSRDEDETTVVAEEQDIGSAEYSAIEKWFKLIEVRVSAPFVALGFLAKITEAIAAKGLNVLVISTFSKDYFLVREESAEKAVQALREIGFKVEE